MKLVEVSIQKKKIILFSLFLFKSTWSIKTKQKGIILFIEIVSKILYILMILLY